MKPKNVTNSLCSHHGESRTRDPKKMGKKQYEGLWKKFFTRKNRRMLNNPYFFYKF